jgi:peroxiredoxin 2/4
MKRLVIVVVSALIAGQLWSQENSDKAAEKVTYKIPLIGESAPVFTAESTNGEINFPADFGRKWKILFSHPQDFTPVCSSEILELAYRQEDFDRIGVKLAVVSTDGISMHQQWKKALESLNIENKGTVKIKFPIIEDQKIVIAREYGMIHPLTNSTKSVRGVFIIDPNDVIQAEFFYPMNVGRSTDELLRLVSALQATWKQLAATPVNWKPGQDMFITYNPSNKESATPEMPPAGFYANSWFMWYKKNGVENPGSMPY